MQKKNAFADLDNARTDEQRSVMEAILSENHCPFCTENLEKYHEHKPIKTTPYWILTKNQWPYEHTQLHLLLIYKEHATTLAELNPKAGQDLFELLQWIEKEYAIPGGGVALRFGDTDYSAGTVAHLHAHCIVPDIHDPNYMDKPVRFKIGKTR